MEEKMKRLMELLNDDSNKTIKPAYTTWNGEEYDGDDDWDDDDEGGNYVAEFGYYAKYKDESIEEEIEELAGELFTHNARPNYSNIKEFGKMSGYSVGPGESDSFGWLTGVIYKDDTMYICWG